MTRDPDTVQPDPSSAEAERVAARDGAVVCDLAAYCARWRSPGGDARGVPARASCPADVLGLSAGRLRVRELQLRRRAGCSPICVVWRAGTLNAGRRVPGPCWRRTSAAFGAGSGSTMFVLRSKVTLADASAAMRAPRTSAGRAAADALRAALDSGTRRPSPRSRPIRPRWSSGSPDARYLVVAPASAAEGARDLRRTRPARVGRRTSRSGSG